MRAFLIAAAVIGVVSSAADVGFSQAKPPAPPSLEGVWMVTSVINTGAAAANSIPDRQPNINIWTKKYYSRILADGPIRPVLAPAKDPAKLTDAEKLARYEHWRPFAAVSGTYEVKGTTWTQHALVAKDQTADIIARNAGKEPTAVAAGQEIKFEGDTLVLIQTLADGKSTNRRTYKRLDRPSSAGIKPHPIDGVWKLTSTVVTGLNASTNRNHQPNIYIYKAGYYTFVNQDGAQPMSPRPVLAPPKDLSNLTDAEKLARYEHWGPGAAQGGRYQIKGTTLYRYPLLAKNQSADTIETSKTGNLGNAAANVEFSFSNGNNTLVQIGRSADGKTVTTRTYTRLE